MTCKIPELRKQLESMQTLLDTYEHCHVDSVTPEEKIVERTKAKCIAAVKSCTVSTSCITQWDNALSEAIKAIESVV